MKNVGELPWYIWSGSTCDHQGRVLNFAPDRQRKLRVSEIFLGEEVGARRVNTGVDCNSTYHYSSSCCSLGDKVLVMAGDEDGTGFFCALVSIDPGELTEASIHIEEKKVTGWGKYKTVPFLVQISESKVWASFDDSDEILIGEIKATELVMTKHPDHLPMTEGFGVLPLRLPAGRFLVAGGLLLSADITLITPGEHFSFEKIGDMSGKGRSYVSTALVEERFVVGFGGWDGDYQNNMWIFDLKTYKISAVKEQGEWHPDSLLAVLVVRDKELYVIGGIETWSVHCLSFASLSQLIQHGGVRRAFCSCLGFPIQPDRVFERSSIVDYAPNYL